MQTLLITPPFTQLNSPYPATAFLKRFLVGQGETVFQRDLGLDLFLAIFSRKGLDQVFEQAESLNYQPDKQCRTIISLSEQYLDCVETVISFLQNRESSLAYLICRKDFLPPGNRLKQAVNLEWAFGTSGIIDQASYLSTLFIEELSDFIRKRLMPDFGFSRYAESLALSATSFDPIHQQLQTEKNLFDVMLRELVDQYLELYCPDLVGFSVPFPGCLLGALKGCMLIKERHPSIKTVLGGGYVNTELRELSDHRIFDYCDYITLDQGELPLLRIIEHLKGTSKEDSLVRTYTADNKSISYRTDSPDAVIAFSDSGYPDYSDLRFRDYLSIMEITNPMHRLWNDGKWNKMMLAQGCYWHKCSFCDVSLSYIKDYATIPAELLVDRIEQVIEQTGLTGFHFVDEAAPPVILKKLSLELIRRKVNISWWTNVRFEKSYHHDFCKLLADAGCIAVAGGLETVSDRLLKKMNKGVSLQKAVAALHGFNSAHIMVHAYLMYGFPTQTEQETINALETVRQLYEHDLIQSSFWHRFSLTAHSAIARDPREFQIRITGPEKDGFAWNDLQHEDPQGCQHEHFGQGLEKATYNYMHGMGFDYETGFWFDFDSVPTTISPDYISLLLDNVAKGTAAGKKTKGKVRTV